MTKLELHYAPGILALLRKDPCPDHATWRGLKECERGGYIYKIAGLHVLQGDEAEWVLHYAPRKTTA